MSDPGHNCVYQMGRRTWAPSSKCRLCSCTAGGAGFHTMWSFVSYQGGAGCLGADLPGLRGQGLACSPFLLQLLCSGAQARMEGLLASTWLGNSKNLDKEGPGQTCLQSAVGHSCDDVCVCVCTCTQRICRRHTQGHTHPLNRFHPFSHGHHTHTHTHTHTHIYTCTRMCSPTHAQAHTPGLAT